MINKYLDIGSILVAIVTLALFGTALVVKGLTHDLFLEAGVFLVSVKIMVMSFKTRIAVNQLNMKLDRVLALLAEHDRRGAR